MLLVHEVGPLQNKKNKWSDIKVDPKKCTCFCASGGGKMTLKLAGIIREIPPEWSSHRGEGRGR